MQVLLIGSAEARRQMRRALGAAATVVGEFESLDDARRTGATAEAAVAAPVRPPDVVLPPADGEAGGAPASRAVDVIEPLTRRETDVLELLAEGLPNKAIAERLGISDQTVKFHAASVMGKLGAANRTEAVRRALRRGLITL